MEYTYYISEKGLLLRWGKTIEVFMEGEWISPEDRVGRARRISAEEAHIVLLKAFKKHFRLIKIKPLGKEINA